MADTPIGQQGSAALQKYPKFLGKKQGSMAVGGEKFYAFPVTNDSFGLMEGTVIWTLPSTQANLMPKKGSGHPYDPRLKCYKTESVHRKGGLLDVTATYVGIESGVSTDVQATMKVGSTTEPIETNPMFRDQIGGTPSSPKNGAIFVDPHTNELSTDDYKAVFSEFPLYLKDIGENGEQKQDKNGSPSMKKNKFAGVKSYYSPTLIVSGVFFTSDDSLAKKISTAQCRYTYDGTVEGFDLLPTYIKNCTKDLLNNINVPEYYQDRNWLVTGVNVEPYGVILKVSYDLTLGGLLGWNPHIYVRSL